MSLISKSTLPLLPVYGKCPTSNSWPAQDRATLSLTFDMNVTAPATCMFSRLVSLLVFSISLGFKNSLFQSSTARWPDACRVLNGDVLEPKLNKFWGLKCCNGYPNTGFLLNLKQYLYGKAIPISHGMKLLPVYRMFQHLSFLVSVIGIKLCFLVMWFSDQISIYMVSLEKAAAYTGNVGFAFIRSNDGMGHDTSCLFILSGMIDKFVMASRSLDWMD